MTMCGDCSFEDHACIHGWLRARLVERARVGENTVPALGQAFYIEQMQLTE
jgi:hypothetical protein